MIAVKRITPDLAREYLSKNDINRPIDKTRLKLYESEMKSGNWTLTSDAIGIDTNGKLCNGQHRLMALLNTGLNFDFIVAEGLPFNSFAKTDTGKLRTAGDVLAIIGAKNYRGVAAIIQAYLKFKSGRTVVHANNTSVGVTNSQILNEYNSRPDYYQEAYKAVMRWYTEILKIVKPSLFGGLYVFLSDVSEEGADKFFTQLSSGIGLTQYSPVKKLRDFLIENASSKRKVTSKEKYAVFIKAWNYYRIGKDVKQLKFDAKRETIQDPI